MWQAGTLRQKCEYEDFRLYMEIGLPFFASVIALIMMASVREAAAATVPPCTAKEIKATIVFDHYMPGHSEPLIQIACFFCHLKNKLQPLGL